VPFNTFAYAKFFALVFVVAWLLSNRQWARLLPWCALAGYAVAFPTWTAGAVAGAAGVVSVLLCKRAPLEHRGATAASVALNAAALSFLSYREQRSDPVSLALTALGAPSTQSVTFGALLVVGAVLAGFAVVRAKKVRLIFILGASYVFYAHWDWRSSLKIKRTILTAKSLYALKIL
jgi:uncharacterized membrane protein YfcA